MTSERLKGSNLYTHTWENGRNLTAITEGSTTYSYTYDEEGIRTSKTVGGTTTYFNYENGQLLSQSDGTNTFIFQYDASGNPAGFIYNGAQYFYLTNAMGDIISIVDTQGNSAMYYYFDSAWGSYVEIDAQTNAMRALARLNPFRYRGYYYDTETGYYYLQSRYYDPEICRFINADCYCDTGTGTVYSTNMFAYCENDPVNCVDPSGYVYYRADSVTYARKYAENYNKAYPNLKSRGGDCTNFVSQCLKAGGMKENALWHCYNKKDFTPIWSYAAKLYKYLVDKGMKTYRANSFTELKEVGKRTDMKRGDLVFFANFKKGIYHATIVSKVVFDNNKIRDVLFCAHSTERLDYSFGKPEVFSKGDYVFMVRVIF